MVDVAVGQSGGRSTGVQGVVYVLTSAPATVAFRTPAYIGVGADVRFGAARGADWVR